MHHLFKKFIYFWALLFVVSSLWTHSSYAAVETTDTEALRNRARQEALERELLQQQPRVDLQAKPAAREVTVFPQDETPCFKIRRFSIDIPEQLSSEAKRQGASASPGDTFYFAKEYLEPFKGRCIGHGGINYLIQNLTTQILARGYSTTRIGIPEQDLANGTLKLTLVPGLIHELKFADAKTAGTWKNAFPAASGDLLNLRDLEQGLEQMKRVPSQEVDMQILPAGSMGESDVVISVKRSKPWRIVATLDDTGAKGTGKYQADLQFAWDNPLGANDLLNIGLNSDANRDDYKHGTQGNSLSYSIPFGYLTASVLAGESTYHQRIQGAVTSFVSSGKSQNFEAKLNYLFHRDQFSKTSVQFRTTKRWSHSYIDDTEVAVQKRNTTHAELSLIHKHNIGQAQLDTTFAYRWGTPWFGAQDEAANIANGSYRYRLETLDTTLNIPFKIKERPLNYRATLRVQNTNTPLFASEWFSIGNRWTVRGFDGESSLGAEKGFFWRNELSYPIPETQQSTYVGLDYGKVYGNNVANLQGDHLAGLVIGLRGALFNGMSYEAFAGTPINKPQRYRSEDPALGFSLMYQM